MVSDTVAKHVEAEQKTKPTFLEFVFFKIARDWRYLASKERVDSANEFLRITEKHKDRVQIRSYSTVGLRRDADFLLWMTADNVDAFQEIIADLLNTYLGKYLDVPYLWMAMTRPSVYTKQHITAFELGLKPLRYLVVYPFVKSREWYLLPFEKRKKMMEEHGKIGRQYPNVRLNTTYSFGLDDQDFMLAFEVGELSEFQDLMMKLRESEVSRYTMRDTPMIVSVMKDLKSIFSSLGA